MASKIEFAVQMTCNSCVADIKQTLNNIDGINNVDVQLATGSVIVDTILSTDQILKLLQSTGRKAVVRGSGISGSGVAIIDIGRLGIQGVVRFMQLDNGSCVIDGTVDGLQSVPHCICIYQCGDLSNGCEGVGPLYVPENSTDPYAGILGESAPNEAGRLTFRFINAQIELHDIIGRSLVIAEKTGKKLACGVIARSAGLFENPKTICACDGVTIWNEKVSQQSSL